MSYKTAFERITVGLLPDTIAALARATERSGLNRPDIVNRAVVVYDFIDEQAREGKELILRGADGDERVKII